MTTVTQKMRGNGPGDPDMCPVHVRSDWGKLAAVVETPTAVG